MEWHKETFFENKLYMELPEELLNMNEEMKQRKFPYPIPPQIIKEDAQMETVFTMSLFEKIIEEKVMEGLLSGMMQKLNHMFPSCLLSNIEIIENKEHIVHSFSYHTDSISGKGIFHILFLFPMEKGHVLGGISSPMNRRNYTKDIFLQIMQRTQIISDSEKHGKREGFE